MYNEINHELQCLTNQCANTLLYKLEVFTLLFLNSYRKHMLYIILLACGTQRS